MTTAGLLDDIRFALRKARRAPGFAIAAIATVALGTGASVGVYTLVDSVALRALPYRDPTRLMAIWETHLERGLTHEPLSPVNALDYRALTNDFVDVAAWWRPEVTLANAATGNPIRVSTVETSENLFRVLGVTPYLGHGFSSDSTLTGTANEVLLSYRLWQSRFGGDRAILGQSIQLNGFYYTVVGIMPSGFAFPGKTDVWQGLNWNMSRHSRGAHFMETIARLRPGASQKRADADLAALTSRLASTFPATNAGWSARLVPLDREIAGVFRPALLALFGAAVLLLMIASSNVTALLLARAYARRQELAVRLAVGADAGRLARMLLVESMLLASVGSLVGLLLAAVGVGAFLHWSPIDIPRAATIGIDPTVVLVALGVTFGTAIAVGILPALTASRQDTQAVLKTGSRALASRGTRARSALVIVEVSLAVTLLVAAGVLIRTVSRLLHESTGVDAHAVITADIQLPDVAYAQWPRVDQFFTRLSDALRAHTEITATGATNFLPLEPAWRMAFEIAGAAPIPGEDQPLAQYHTVDDGYFATLHIPIQRGRGFDRHDSPTGLPVVIVNETFARQFWPGENPIGKHVRTEVRQVGPLGLRVVAGDEHEVIGVVRDVKNTSLKAAAEPALFFSERQFPFRSMHLVVRGQAEPAALETIVRDEVHRLDPTLALGSTTTMERTLSAAADPPRFAMMLLTVFAALALLLAAIGIYGILTFMIGQRRKEFGIRLALGATPANVFQLVLREGLVLTLSGCLLGVLLWSIGGRALTILLYGVKPWDPMTLGAVAALVVAVALVACLVPGGRAAADHPLTALNME